MKKILFFVTILLAVGAHAQTFTHADTLRGSITPQRAWWDARHYDLHVAFNYDKKTISGWNTVTYEVLTDAPEALQIDLMAPLTLDSAVQNGQKLGWKKDGNAHFIQLPEAQRKGAFQKITLHYHGTPTEAARAPWDGGVVWGRDEQSRPWITVACQGVGPSIWYPCKDHQYDEPDSAALHITIPNTLRAVANGRLRNRLDNGNGTTTWHWAVVNPINNYNLIPYIGAYARFQDVYKGEKGPLDLDFWALDYNLEKAKSWFLPQTTEMLRCFEYWFGPYPFYADGFKLVESPHLGMEHQSAIAYGNKYQYGYLGSDLSGTGVGLKWDFILVHESGHEWFGNNISTKDIADMWVHEGFTNYSETLLTGCQQNEDAATRYNVGSRDNIQNSMPIISTYGVNREGSGDMYYKGGAMVHMIRAVMDDDEKFRQLLRGMNKDFWHQTVTTQQIEAYISKCSGHDFSRMFDQYLRTVQIPTLELKTKKGSLEYRWKNCIPGFDMPVRVSFDGVKWQWLRPTTAAQILKVENSKDVQVDPRFYIQIEK